MRLTSAKFDQKLPHTLIFSTLLLWNKTLTKIGLEKVVEIICNISNFNPQKRC